MANIADIIDNVYQLVSRSGRIIRNDGNAPITDTKYMEIPINTDEFELPVFAFHDFLDMLEQNIPYNTIVAILYSTEARSPYVTVNSILKDVLVSYWRYHLCKVPAGQDKVYYATNGAIFDSEFNPVMMMSWVIKKVIVEDKPQYEFKRPLLRISPQVLIEKSDPVQKAIAGGLFSKSLALNIKYPDSYRYDSYFKCYNWIDLPCYTIKIEIDKCPFVIRSADVPSISVTNEKLLQIAVDHVEETLQ